MGGREEGTSRTPGPLPGPHVVVEVLSHCRRSILPHCRRSILDVVRWEGERGAFLPRRAECRAVFLPRRAECRPVFLPRAGVQSAGRSSSHGLACRVGSTPTVFLPRAGVQSAGRSSSHGLACRVPVGECRVFLPRAGVQSLHRVGAPTLGLARAMTIHETATGTEYDILQRGAGKDDQSPVSLPRVLQDRFPRLFQDLPQQFHSIVGLAGRGG